MSKENPFDTIAQQFGVQPTGNNGVDTQNKTASSNNPFDSIAETYNLPKSTGSFSSYDNPGSPTKSHAQAYADILKTKDEAKVAKTQADEANSFGGMAKNAFKSAFGIGEFDGQSSLYNLAKEVVTNPIETGRNVIQSALNGATFGALEWGQRKAITAYTKSLGLDEKQTQEIIDKTFAPQNESQDAIHSGFQFAGAMAPAILSEGVLTAGLKYATPEFVASHGILTSMLQAGTGNAVFGAADAGANRDPNYDAKTAATDFAIGAPFGPLIPAAGRVYRYLRKAKVAPESIVPTTVDNAVTEASLIKQTHDNASELLGKNAPDTTGVQSISDLDTLYKNSLSPEEYAKVKPVLDNAHSVKNSAMTTENAVPEQMGQTVDGKYYTPDEVKAFQGDAKTAASVDVNGKPTTFITNDIDGLSNYIKGSGNISYEIVPTLGKDGAGNKVMARFTLDSSGQGNHLIQVTDAATAGNVAHELGHYFDNKLTATVDSKLSTMVRNFDKNREAIESALGSYATERLGGNATSEAISKDIADMVTKIKSEVDILSSERRGKLISSPSERFADAVSEIATKSGQAEKAPVLTGLLKHSERYDKVQLFGGKKLVREVAKKAEEVMPKNVVQAEGMHFKLSGKALTEYTKALDEYNSRKALYKGKMDTRSQGSLKAIGMEFSAKKREITGQYTEKELQKLIVKERSNYIGKQVKATINGKEMDVKINSTPHYGNTEVKLRNGRTMSIKNSAILPDTRKTEEIIAKVTERPGVTPYSIESDMTPMKDVPVETKPKEVAPVKEVPPVTETPKEVPPTPETKVIEKKVVVEKAPELDRGQTGRKPDTVAARAELITKTKEAQDFINEKVLKDVAGKERISKTNADILEQSYNSNLTEESFNKILNERLGNISADVLKAKQIMADNAYTLSNKLAGRDISELSGDELVDAMADYTRLVETFETFAGVRTELSNAFRTLGTSVNAAENDVFREALAEIQKSIGGATDPFKILQGALKANERDAVTKFFDIWYASTLSGPFTQIKNIVGNTVQLGSDIASRAFSRGGRKEAWAMMDSIINGNKDAWNEAVAVFKGEHNIATKLTETSSPKEHLFDATGPFAFGNKLEYVGKFMSGADAYTSTLAKNAEIAAQRVGDNTYGLANKELQKKLNESVAEHYGQFITYRGQFDNTVLGLAGKSVNAFKNSDNVIAKIIGTALFPFVKTVSKVTDRAIDFTPVLNIFRSFDTLGAYKVFNQRAERIIKDAGVFDSVMRDAIENGSTAVEARAIAEAESKRVQDIVVTRIRNQQMGRAFMGLTVLAAGMPLAIAGRITGSGPDNKNERDTLMASGWRPNSIIMPNGVALPYQVLGGPFQIILSALGNMSDAVKYNKTESIPNEVSIAMKKMLKSQLDQSFFSGISNLMDGITGYTTPEQMRANLLTSFIPIPNAWTQTKNAIFPERYEPHGFNETIRNKLGMTGDFFGTGLTDPLQPSLNAFGEQRKADLIYGLTPPLMNAKTDDKVLNYLVENNISFGKPQKGQKVISGKKEREMTPEEYTRYVEKSGSRIYDELNLKVSSGYFNRFKTTKEKKDALDAIVKRVRAQEKAKIHY